MKTLLPTALAILLCWLCPSLSTNAQPPYLPKTVRTPNRVYNLTNPTNRNLPFMIIIAHPRTQQCRVGGWMVAVCCG